MKSYGRNYPENSFLTQDILQEARAAGQRTKALDAARPATAGVKEIIKKKHEQHKIKRELFCQENLQEIEDNLLSSEEPSTAEGNRSEEASVADASNAIIEDGLLDEESAENFMEE